MCGERGPEAFWLQAEPVRRSSEEFVVESLRALRAQRVRERALVHEEGRTEVEPAASRTCRQNRRANQRTSREVATFPFSLFIWELNVSVVRPRPSSSNR